MEMWVAESVSVHGVRVLDFVIAVEAANLCLNSVDVSPKASLIHSIFDVVEIVAAAFLWNIGRDAVYVQ